MGVAKDSLIKIVEKINQNPKAKDVFVTNIAGRDINWEMYFQFNLTNEEPFYLEIKNRKARLLDGRKAEANIVMSGDSTSLVKICNGKGDFTHAISREEITVEKGKVMDIIRLTRAISTTLKSN